MKIDLQGAKPDKGYWWGDYVKIGGQKSAKAVALDACRAYLLDVRKHLGWKPHRGKHWGATGVQINPGGPAVCGDVYAVFHKNGLDAVYISINPDNLTKNRYTVDPIKTAYTLLDIGPLGILYRRCTPDQPFGGGIEPGFGNQWARPDTDSAELAELIRKLYPSIRIPPRRRVPLRSNFQW